MVTSFQTADRYRIVEEPRILELLLLYGWVHELRHGARLTALAEARDALEAWVGLGLAFRRQDGRRFFDPAEVVNFAKWAGILEGNPIWQKRFVATGRTLVLDHHGLDSGAGKPPDPATLPPASFSLLLSREFNLENWPVGAPVHLRLPCPLEDGTLRDLKTECILPPEIAVECSIGPGRLDAKLKVPQERKIRLGLRASFTAHPWKPGVQTAALSTPDIELYTRPREGLVQLSPRIRALAGELTQGIGEPRAAIERFWNFIIDELTCGIVHYDGLDEACPADWSLQSGWFDCQLGSALLVALCRAKGIPARIVSGYLLYPASPSDHYWAEAWVDGEWLPLDLACSDLSAGGRDTDWRNTFFGRLDYRLKTQCLPRLFNTIPSIRLPQIWHVLSHAEQNGIETAFYDSESGALIYRDRFSVTRFSP